MFQSATQPHELMAAVKKNKRQRENEKLRKREQREMLVQFAKEKQQREQDEQQQKKNELQQKKNKQQQQRNEQQYQTLNKAKVSKDTNGKK